MRKKTGLQRPTGSIGTWLDTFCTGKPRIGTIVKAAARVWGVREAEILSDQRFAYMLKPRRAVMFLAVHKLGFASSFTAHYVNRDHSTVIYSANKVLNALCDGDPEYAANISKTWTLACQMQQAQMAQGIHPVVEVAA